VSQYANHLSGAPSGLTEREYSLLAYLTIKSLMDNFGESEETTVAALEEAAERGMILIRGDQKRVQVIWKQESGETVLVDAGRVALRWVAHPTGQLDN
jgi:hypothetical protein